MRILLINDFIEKIGGVEIYCYGLKSLLEREGHKVKFLGGEGGLEGSKLRRFISTIFSIKYYLRIKSEIKDFEPDIIHAHSFSGNISPSFLIAAKKYDIPVVVTPPNFFHYIHTLPKITLKKPYRIISWLKAWFHQELKKKYIDYFICPSNIFAEHLKNNVGIDSSKISIVRHFIEWEQPAEAKNPTTKDILYAGRLSEEKGIEYLIHAISKISKEHPKIKLHIVGEGNMEQNIRSLANKLGIEDKVIFHGYVAHENLATMYRKSSVFILPSICMENAPLTLIEAMSQGTPVVTTNIGGQAELVKNGVNGLLVNPRDSEDLAEKIGSILDNPELAREMGEGGRKIVEETHTPKKHLRRIIEIYNSLIGGAKE
jgi:glycosyltransferase involved in cell wall biosynthesis